MADADWGQVFQKFVSGGVRAAMGIPTVPDPNMPAPVLLTIPDIMKGLQEALDHSNDPKEAPRLALMLTCILAHQNGWSTGEVIKEATSMWTNTAALHKGP